MIYIFVQIKSILSDMLKNKLRILLTMSGTIIGVASVIIIISVGNAASSVTSNYFSGTLGANSVKSYVSVKDGMDYSDFLLSYDELKSIASKIDGAIGPLVESPESIYGRISADSEHYANISIKGVTPAYFKGTNIQLICGRFVNEHDCERVASTAVISDIAAVNCYGSVENAIGKTFVLNGDTAIVEASVVGVYKYIDTTGKLGAVKDLRDWDSHAFCPYEFVNQCLRADESILRYFDATIIMDDGADTGIAAYELDNIMEDRFSVPYYGANTYPGYGDVDSIKSIIRTITLVFICAAALSLLVGGINLMNTLLVTVKERTREIGVKKAIGASNFRIIMQFLLESVVICLSACLIGIAVSHVIIAVMTRNMPSLIDLIPDDGLKMFLITNGIRVKVDLTAVLVSTGFSVSVGLIFGLYPAVKAAAMQITDALRYE